MGDVMVRSFKGKTITNRLGRISFNIMDIECYDGSLIVWIKNVSHFDYLLSNQEAWDVEIFSWVFVDKLFLYFGYRPHIIVKYNGRVYADDTHQN